MRKFTHLFWVGQEWIAERPLGFLLGWCGVWAVVILITVFCTD